ncbi:MULTISPECIES: CidA/LrgA family holin-like protein [Paenibacillus]|uniref:CidA/LrgA family holin-like protein n=1 Tax=Paenibacillus oleatilyticus TaxID=2594886 RepID=A0ABV4V385_9BACL|nr:MULTISPECIES: CidA/LrgA family holin-like protein [Paenibacillus]MBU7315754.1 CidA/LrgA family holin-like protein [Paenibacillus oleatilyticus]
MTAFVKTLGQVLFFVLVSWLLNGLAALLHLPVPGSILGIILVFVLLQLKIIRIEWIDLGAKWLLAEMLLFFIPAAAGMIQYQSLLRDNGLPIMLVLVSSLIVVMLSAGLVAQAIVKRKERTPS